MVLSVKSPGMLWIWSPYVNVSHENGGGNKDSARQENAATESSSRKELNRASLRAECKAVHGKIKW